MSWEFVYCPRCGTDQTKVGGAEEVFFCAECCIEWNEGGKKKKGKKKGKNKERLL